MVDIFIQDFLQLIELGFHEWEVSFLLSEAGLKQSDLFFMIADDLVGGEGIFPEIGEFIVSEDHLLEIKLLELWEGIFDKGFILADDPSIKI